MKKRISSLSAPFCLPSHLISSCEFSSYQRTGDVDLLLGHAIWDRDICMSANPGMDRIKRGSLCEGERVEWEKPQAPSFEDG
jgi:hypothetical protein